MGDAVKEVKQTQTTTENTNNLQSVWAEGNLADFRRGSLSSNPLLSDVTLTNADSGTQAQRLPIHELTDLQAQLERTQKMIQGITSGVDLGLSGFEQSSRSLTGNPYKLVLAGTGMGLLYKSSWGAAPLAGLAALQGYDDIKMLGRQDSLAGRTKYTLGLLGDGATLAGAAGYLTDAIPSKYRVPLLFGGLALRAAIDFIPERKTK